MLSFLKFVTWLLVTKTATATATQTINRVNCSHQEILRYERTELQFLHSELIVGVDKAFQKLGVTLKEATGIEYALIPVKFLQQEWEYEWQQEQQEEQQQQCHAKWYKIEWEDLPNIVKDWIKANPCQTAFYIANGAVFFAPTAASGPVLWLLGFTSVGLRAGSLASFLQKKIGLAAGRSVFSFLQSAGMGGYGTAAVRMVTRLLAAALGSFGPRLCG